MKNEKIHNGNHLAILVIAVFVFICAGCSSSIEIVGSERPAMTDSQKLVVADELTKRTHLGKLEFSDSAEEKAFFFGLQLYYSQEYYRAITEFMRFMSYFENSKYVQLAYFLVGESFRASGDHANAVFFYTKAKEILTESSEAFEFSWLADFNITVCMISQGKYTDARAQLAKLTETPKDEPDKNSAVKFFNEFLNLVLTVADKDYEKAAEMLKTLDKKQLREFTGVQIDENDVLKFDDIPTKNVALSVIMSTLVPGLGQLYADRPLEALTSFLLNGLFTFIAYEAFSEDQEVLGAVSAFLAASFYFANIYNSANAAISYNDNSRIEFYNRLLNKLDSDVLHFFIMPEETEAGLTFTFKTLR